MNHTASTKNQHSSGEAKQQKPLDLSVPLRHVSFEESPETLAIREDTSLDALSAAYKRQSKAVELQGNLIMTQEPEAEKTKSADGAGIMINLHH